MNAERENRVELRLYALLWQREIINHAAREAGMSPGAWMFRAISNQLVSEGAQPLGEYPAETRGGKRVGAGARRKVEGG